MSVTDSKAKKSSDALSRKTIALQLTAALPELKTVLGDKKFERRVKKAAKLLISGIKTKEIKKPVSKVKAITAAPKAKSVKAAQKKKPVTKAAPKSEAE